MRLYNVITKKKTLIVAAHNPLQAASISGFMKIEHVEEIDIREPIIVCEKCQESTPTEK